MSQSTYEPPRLDLPVGVDTGVVYGTVLRAVDDGPDVGIVTDSLPSLGFITFQPTTPVIYFGENLIGLTKRTAILDSNGSFEIDLVATDNSSPVENWTYQVQFSTNPPIPTFFIQVPGHSRRSLSELIPITGDPSYYTTKGDKGDKGDLSVAGLGVYLDEDGDLALSDSDALLWGTGNPNSQSLYKPAGHLFVDKSASTLYIKTTSTATNTGWETVLATGGGGGGLVDIDYQSAIDIMEAP